MPSLRRHDLYDVPVLQLVLLSQPHLALAVDGKEEALPDIGVHPEGQVARRAAPFHEECIGQDHALSVAKFVLILHRIEHDIVEQLEDGPVDALLHSSSAVLLHERPDLLQTRCLGFVELAHDLKVGVAWLVFDQPRLLGHA